MPRCTGRSADNTTCHFSKGDRPSGRPICELLTICDLFFFSSRRRHTRLTVTGVQTCALPIYPAATELERLVDWRVRFAVEALGATDGPDLRQASADDVRLQHERGTDWLLLAGATPRSGERRVGEECRSRWAPDH